ncbi:unnamed protein product, partial [Arabidopsis halleri]
MFHVRSPYAWWTPVTLLKYRLIIPLNYATHRLPVAPVYFLLPSAIRTTGFTGKPGTIIKLASTEKSPVLLCSLFNVFVPRVSSAKDKRGSCIKWKLLENLTKDKKLNRIHACPLPMSANHNLPNQPMEVEMTHLPLYASV